MKSIQLALLLVVAFGMAWKPAEKSEVVKAETKTLDLSGCEWNGIALHGKVQVVDAFGDIKVEYVDAFGDIKVQWVDAFPDDCGEWEEVDAFPDFTIEIVDAFGDIKVEVVDAFPGVD